MYISAIKRVLQMSELRKNCMICATRQTQEEVVLINYNEYC